YVDETLGQFVDVIADQLHVGKQGTERNAGFNQLLAGVVDARVGNTQAHAFRHDVTQLDRLGHDVGGDLLSEVGDQFLVVDVVGNLGIAPGGHRHFQPENIVQVAAFLPGIQQVTDVVDGETALEQ